EPLSRAGRARFDRGRRSARDRFQEVGSMGRQWMRMERRRLIGLALIGAQLAAAVAPALAAPLGGTVAAGQATISSTGMLTEIRQSSDRAIVNWQGFSTSAGEAVRFQQPSASAVTLNRVVSADPSV